MPVSRLLKSWAMPPVSCPTASIFWAWQQGLLGGLQPFGRAFSAVTSRADRVIVVLVGYPGP